MTKNVKLHLILIFLRQQISCAIYSAISITWCQCKHQMQSMTKKFMLHLIAIILTKWMHSCHWWYYWHYIMLILVPLASHVQNIHVAFHFHHPDLTNRMVPLMTLCIMWYWHQHQWHHDQKKVCCSMFQWPWPNECNGAINNALDIP